MSDADYKLFLESLENPENDAVFSLDAYVEELEAKASQRKGAFAACCVFCLS